MTHKDNELLQKIDKALDLIVVASVDKYDAFAITETVELAKDALLELFTTTLQQREREVRLQELCKLQEDAGYGEYTASEYKMDIELRIEALSKTDKEN